MTATSLSDFRCPVCDRLLAREDIQGRLEVKCRNCKTVASLDRTIHGCKDCPALEALSQTLSKRDQ